jgi:hypothetical protein
MPLSHQSKRKVGTSNQIQLCQTINTSSGFENIQQLVEILKKKGFSRASSKT